MPINVACDHCGQSLQVLEEHAGKQVRCPKCYQVFVAKASAGAPAAAVPPPPFTPPTPFSPPPSDPNALPQGVVSAPSPAGGIGGHRFCAHCGAPMPAAAGFCPACGKAPPAVPPQVFGGAVPPGGMPSPYAPIPQNNGLAVASLILGIVSWVLCMSLLGSVPAIICGHIARGQIAKSNGMQTGDGMALAGLVLGYLNLLATCGMIGSGFSGGHYRHF